MNSILIFGIALQALLYIYKNQEEYETLYVVKCIIYLFISCIHSVIIILKVPLGACLMGFIYLLDKVNRRVKFRMILSGLFITLLSTINYQDISIPLHKLYLNHIQTDISQIEVYTNNSVNPKYLFSIDDTSEIQTWMNSFKKSSAYTSWDYKILPQDHGYLINLYTPNKVIPVIVSSYTSHLPNVFIGKKFITYMNASLPDLINSYFDIKPISLKILDEDIEIKDIHIINDLWEEILWATPINSSHLSIQLSDITALLTFNKDHIIKLSFSKDFTYAKLNNDFYIKLSPYLINKLNEQYILSSLNKVNHFTTYNPVHIHTPTNNIMHYSIELDDSGRYYGLYLSNEIDNTKTLLHNVSSINSEYFLLKNPYILLLDEKYPSQYYLMLINQNIPYKHRYIEKNKNIVPSSIALCPQNTKFTYTIYHNDISTLYLVNSYYDIPTVIATGDILDSLFLSERYIAYSLILDSQNLLCIYDTDLSKTVKYITIPGNIHLVRVQNNCIVFSVQNEENSVLKEGLFSINTDFKIEKVD